MYVLLYAADSSNATTSFAVALTAVGVISGAFATIVTSYVSRHKFRAEAESIAVASAEHMITRLESEVATLVAARREDRKQISSLDTRLRRSEDRERDCAINLADAFRQIADLKKLVEGK